MLEKENPMIKMAWHFGVSMIRHWWAKRWGYEIFTPKAALAFRDCHCRVCPNNEDGQCKKCNRLILSKTMMALEECPIGLWHRVWVKRKM
jgi:hypothetical protein